MSNYILSLNPPADCTPDEVEAAIAYFVTLPLDELRRRQEIVEGQRAHVNGSKMYQTERDEALRQLDARAEHLRLAIDRQQFNV